MSHSILFVLCLILTSILMPSYDSFQVDDDGVQLPSTWKKYLTKIILSGFVLWFVLDFEYVVGEVLDGSLFRHYYSMLGESITIIMNPIHTLLE